MMSTSADIQTNGNGHTSHDHILRPRALKPANPAVIRAISEEGLLSVESAESNTTSGQTRYILSPDRQTRLTISVAVRLQSQQMHHRRNTLYHRRESSYEQSNEDDCSLPLSMPRGFPISIQIANIETFTAFSPCFGLP